MPGLLLFDGAGELPDVVDTDGVLVTLGLHDAEPTRQRCQQPRHVSKFQDSLHQAHLRHRELQPNSKNVRPGSRETDKESGGRCRLYDRAVTE